MLYKKKIVFLLFLSCITIILISILIIKNLGLKTIEIEKTTLEQGINANAFIIQKEDIVLFNGKNNIEIEAREGIKVSLDSIIANTKGADFNNQDIINLEIINWKLENEMYQEIDLFQKDLEKINQDIKNLEINIEKAKKLNNSEKIESLQRKKNDLIHKKEVIEGSFRFAFIDDEGLNSIKNKILSKENNSTSVKGIITPKDIGINYPSYILHKKDGLENLLHRDLLGKINTDYYTKIENLISEENQPTTFENQQILKFIDDSKLYLIVKIPKNFLSEEEVKLIKIKNDLNLQWKESGHTNIYNFIEARRDILKSFPEIKIVWEDRIIKGILIDINNDTNDNEKVITIKIDSLNHRLIGKRQLELYIYNNLYTGFIIPKSSIIQEEGKDGVILLGRANEEKFVEVFIKNKLEEFIVLDPDENIKLKQGSKILARPK